MTHHVFTRQALYDLVWAEPMRTIAGRLGVSDVGLAKACRRADIPVPKRGYWAKLQHGKATVRPRLPRTKGTDQVVIAPAAPRLAPSPVAQAVVDSTPPPAIEIPETLERPHAIVREWIRQNKEDRRERRRMDWGLDNLPDLDTPLEQRRLRLYSALFRALAAAGLTLEPGRSPDDFTKVVRGAEHIPFRIYVRSTQVRRPLTAEEKKWSWNASRKDTFDLVSAEDLVVRINRFTRGAMAETYRETKRTLEDQLGELVVAFQAGLAELDAWREEQEAAAAARREAEIRRAQAARREAERLAWRERLAGHAAHWRQARDIREMVAALEASPRAAEPDFAGWRAAALAAADEIDPLTNDMPLRLPEAMQKSDTVAP